MAAARTPQDVCREVLTPALEALGANAGAVFLVDETGERLHLAATRGDEGGAHTLRQDGALNGNSPAVAALGRREPLSSGSRGDLPRAYPGLETPTTLRVPMVLGDAPLGVIVLEFHAPRGSMPEEQRFLRALSTLGAFALGRLRLDRDLERRVRERTANLEEERTALAAFAHFTEASTHLMDTRALVEEAGAVLRDLLGVHVGYSELENGRWKGALFSGDTPPQVVAAAWMGFSAELPSFARPFLERDAVFVDGWDGKREGAEVTGMYTAAALYPYFQQGRPCGLLTIGSLHTSAWTERERSVFRSVGRSLTLALERAQAQQDAEERTRQIEEDARAQAAFAAFTEAVGTETDVLALARQAIAVLRARFADASVGYYEREGGLWKARVWSEDVREDVAALLQAGLPDETPMFARVLQARQAVFTDAWDAAREGLESTGEYRTVANYPLLDGGEVRSVLSVGLKDTRQWSGRDQGLVRAVGRGLALALERAEQTRRLAEQNAELAARTRALEGFADLTRDLAMQTDASALIRRGQEVVRSLLPGGYAQYFEPEGGRWRLKVQTGTVLDPGLQVATAAGFPLDTTPSLTVPWTTRQPWYQDEYAKDADIDPGLVQHVGTLATLPVLVNGEPVGVFGTVLFDPRPWTPTEQVVLETVVRSLGLALERAQGVARLAEERRKLEVANEELEAFAYSVSHDLRTPVRHIGSFTDLLRKHLGDSLDAKAARYLGIVGEATERMNILIDAMLDLSRTSRLPLQIGVVDLEKLVRTVRAELEADVPDRQVEWVISPLPLVKGDPHTLRQVMLNLLSNALKYTRTREVTRIEVWAEDRPGEWAIFVRDNGVGFDPRYADRLFGVFQRLHRHEEFEGTGVGLANVRRIVTRHEGRVWASAQLGQGATFGFTLPR
nr:GAF domain-containing protein [Deinococcus sp. HSC-46F16]